MNQGRNGWGTGSLWVGLLACCLAGTAGAQDFSGGTKVPGPQSAALQAANAALEARDWEKAVKLLTPLAAANPSDAHVLYDLGSAQDALDQTSGAEQSYRAAILDDGAYLEPRVALGLLLARNGGMTDARAELVAAVGVKDGAKPLQARALRALARIDEKTRPGDARDELLAALSISPETPEDTLLTAELAEHANGGQEAAEAAYRRLLLEQPNDPDATASLAHLLAAEKKYPEAEKLLTDGLAAHPGDLGLTIQLAEVYTTEQKTAQALPLVEQLHQADPTEANVTHLLAELYVQAKDWAKAEPLLAALSTEAPSDGALADLHAEALMHLRQFAEAQRLLTRVVAQPALFKSTEDWGLAAGDLAFVASEQNEPAVVLQILENRAKVLPPSAPILWLTAISQDKLRHRKLAEEAYQQFLAASNGANPNEEFEARHRLVALENTK
jgi:tetratricopeptide (TPR) repeat protein